ncbi:winged helix-turn-helix domain-containing protein [Frisingicoccus sp.]
MKKNIGYVNLDSPMIDWLIKELKSVPPELNSSELKEALNELKNASYSSIMLELEDEQYTYTVREIVCKDLRIIPSARKVLRSNEEILLTPKEFDILLFLAKNRGEIFTKEQIFKAVWGSEYLMDDSNIMAFIRKLRKKIEPFPDEPEYILTIWGIGYKFCE